MSTAAAAAPPKPALVNIGTVVVWLSVLVGVGAAGWYGRIAYRNLTTPPEVIIPTATVQRGDITLSVTAKGELRGGNSESLIAPMTGGSDMHLTYLLKTGEEVKAGDKIAEFDTTEQEYKLKEAQADLAEAEQHIIQAKAQRDADQEEDRYALQKAKTDVQLAELDVRQNPILPAINAKQNDLALEAARDHLAQLEQNLKNRKATNDAAIAMQEAGKGKAESQATTARQNIEAMTLRAKRAGYVSIKPNTNQNMIYTGMVLPPFQIGDAVRPGMAVAEIPDLKDWELSAKMGELDRGHLALGDKVDITVIAIPDHPFHGHVKDVGGITGNFFERGFECKISVDDPTPELRGGMSTQIVITTDQLHNVLWLPAQALFESDGKTFVYAKSGSTFAPKDVKLVRRNETRVVITGVEAGQVVALSNPTDTVKKKETPANAAKALGK
jgi:multidrug efflux pump subunit AcrA (membrane-fusion protein)